MIIRPALTGDCQQIANLRAALWPEGSAAEHAHDLEQILSGEWSKIYPYVVFAAEADGGEIIGFADVTLRARADGCDPTRAVGYLEGWYVSDRYRRRGVGAALLAAAEAWVMAQGCSEIASDTWMTNEGSQRAHEALGFEMVDRVVTYRKSLT